MMKSVMLAGALSLSLAGAAIAAGNDTAPNRSDCGAAHAAAANVNGNFGFIGQDFQGAPNYHGGVRGQEPGATGYNNSHTNCQSNPS